MECLEYLKRITVSGVFFTRGKKNIETQFFLLAFAFNIEKTVQLYEKGRIGLDLFALNTS